MGVQNCFQGPHKSTQTNKNKIRLEFPVFVLRVLDYYGACDYAFSRPGVWVPVVDQAPICHNTGQVPVSRIGGVVWCGVAWRGCARGRGGWIRIGTLAAQLHIIFKDKAGSRIIGFLAWPTCVRVAFVSVCEHT